MNSIITLENPILGIDKLQIFESVLTDYGDVLFPTIINDKYYHFKKGKDSYWHVIGLSNKTSDFVRVIIERYLFIKRIAI